MTKVFNYSEFAPGQVHWDTFDVDPDKPLMEQMRESYEFFEGLFDVEFPNGCRLLIDWFPQGEQDGKRDRSKLMYIPCPFCLYAANSPQNE